MLNYIDEGSIAYVDVVLVLVDIGSVTWDGDTRGFLWKGKGLMSCDEYFY